MKKLSKVSSILSPESGSETNQILDNPCFSVQSIQAITESSSEFMKELDLSAVELARVYDDGTATILYSDPKISKYVVENKVHVTAHVSPSAVNSQFWYLPSKDGPYLKLLSDIKEMSGGAGFADFIQRFNGYFDMFCFWSNKGQDETSNLFINQKERAEKFCFELRDKLGQLVAKLGKTPILLPEEMRANFKGLDSEENGRLTSKISSYYSSISNEIELLLSQNNTLKLSNRELDCVAFLIQGKTSKQMAEAMGLSCRTVEHYIDNLRKKVGSRKKSEILDQLRVKLSSR